MHKTTEQDSKYKHLEKMDILSILKNINKEDQTVAQAVAKQIPEIEAAVATIYKCVSEGGRLFYIGAGTSGRLGVVDASECPPTFGVADNVVIGLIAGGESAIRKAVEFAEDDLDGAWKDLQNFNINEKDFVLGIAASGTTPYVLGALKKCNNKNIATGCIVCNENSPIAAHSKFPIECIVGPEFITGSSRMKAGTAQKMILNMISTSLMIKLGKVKGNKMVDMQLSNHKLVARGVQMIINETGIAEEKAALLLKKYGSVRKAVDSL